MGIDHARGQHARNWVPMEESSRRLQRSGRTEYEECHLHDGRNRKQRKENSEEPRAHPEPLRPLVEGRGRKREPRCEPSEDHDTEQKSVHDCGQSNFPQQAVQGHCPPGPGTENECHERGLTRKTRYADGNENSDERSRPRIRGRHLAIGMTDRPIFLPFHSNRCIGNRLCRRLTEAI